MDLISATGVTKSGITETMQVPGESASSTLRAAVVDWVSSRQRVRSDTASADGAEVLVATALERRKQPLTVCARLRRGVREAAVREAFTQCHAELAKDLPETVVLVIEQQPIRRSLADEYCDITTNEPAEHTYLFTSALRKIMDRNSAQGRRHDDDRLLAMQLTEIAVAFPSARDSLEELLWQHRR